MLDHRIYFFSDKYIKLWLPLAIIFILVSVVMLGAVYLNYNPTETQPVLGTQTEVVQVDAQVQSQLTNDTILYNESDVISGPLFFNESNPEVQFQYDITADREIDSDINVYASIVGESRGFEFWNQEYVLEDRDISFEEETGSATVDINRIRERTFDVREDFDQQGSITTNIVFELDYTSEEYSGSIDDEMQIIFRQDTFSVLPPEFDGTETHRVSTVEGEEEVGDSLFINAGLVAGGLGIFVLFIRFVVADPSRKRRDYLLMRFDDWISTTSEQRETEKSDNIIKVNKCEDLVDIAADTNGRVIRYKDYNELAVYGDDRCYLYEVTEDERSKVRFGLLEFSDDRDDQEEDEDEDSTSIRDRFRFIC